MEAQEYSEEASSGEVSGSSDFSEESGGEDSDMDIDPEDEGEDPADDVLRKKVKHRGRKGGAQPRKKRSSYHLSLHQKALIIEQHDKTGKKGAALGRIVGNMPQFSRKSPPSRTAVYLVLKQRKEIQAAVQRAGMWSVTCSSHECTFSTPVPSQFIFIIH
jgi:hypothetical protein